MLLWACTNGPESTPDPSDSPEDSPGDGWVCDRSVIGSPWDEPDFWTNPGPLAELVNYQATDAAHWELRVAWSEDRRTWTADSRVLASHVSSLGVIETTNGLVFTAGVDALPVEKMGLSPPGTREILLLSTQDLITWGTHYYRVMGEELYLTDPSLFIDTSGTPYVVYYPFDGSNDNPGTVPGPHPIHTARWDGGCFTELPAVAQIEGAIDPSICREPTSGLWWLFTTASEGRVAALVGEAPTAFLEAASWESTTVPFCRAQESGIEVLGQTLDGLLPVKRAMITPHQELVIGEDLYQNAPFSNCTSPVLVEWQARYALFCAVWTQP